MLKAFLKFSPKPKFGIELVKKMLQVIWDNMPQRPINNTYKKLTI